MTHLADKVPQLPSLPTAKKKSRCRKRSLFHGATIPSPFDGLLFVLRKLRGDEIDVGRSSGADQASRRRVARSSRHGTECALGTGEETDSLCNHSNIWQLRERVADASNTTHAIGRVYNSTPVRLMHNHRYQTRNMYPSLARPAHRTVTPAFVHAPTPAQGA